jgi:hypothetical protein
VAGDAGRAGLRTERLDAADRLPDVSTALTVYVYAVDAVSPESVYDVVVTVAASIDPR